MQNVRVSFILYFMCFFKNDKNNIYKLSLRGIPKDANDFLGFDAFSLYKMKRFYSNKQVLYEYTI